MANAHAFKGERRTYAMEALAMGGDKVSSHSVSLP